MNRVNYFLLFFLLLSVTLFSQEKSLLKPNGEIIPISIADHQKTINKKSNKIESFGTGDTLSYRDFFDATNVNFGFFGHDRMIQWFVAPYDLRIISVGIMCYENNPDGNPVQISLKLVKFDWTYQQLEDVAPVGSPQYLGYYEANGNGYNDITAYLDDPDRTGPWVDASGEGFTSPFELDLWSDAGVGYPFTPIADINVSTYNWVPMNLLFEPEVQEGDIFGISIFNLHPIMNEGRVGIYAAYNDFTQLPDFYKFYADGRTVPPPDPNSDEGWWAREFTLDFVVEVEAVIPVELTSFTAVLQNDEVLLSWITATETNNKGFSIERKISNKWESIAFVDGFGTTTEEQTYQVKDNVTGLSDHIYYRLKQVDLDGTFEYSDEVEVVIPPLDYSISQNYPNPFNPTTKIDFSLPQKNLVTIKVFDILGNEIKTLLNGVKDAGKHSVKFDASDIPSGVYYYKIQAGKFVDTKKMIVLK